MNDEMNTTADKTIHSQPFPVCPVCGSAGSTFRQGLTDVFFNSPGKWDSKKCTNPGCRMVWLDPMPLEKDIHKAYDDYQISSQLTTDIREQHIPGFYRAMQKGYWAERYGYGRAENWQERLGGKAVKLHRGWKEALDVNVFYSRNLHGGRLLEIGCGAGRQLKLMQDLGWQVEGIDADLRVVELARKKGLKVSHGYVYDQQYADETFNTIILNHVIEHVFELDRFLPELYRILKKGGRLVMLTPNLESLGSRMYRNFVDSIMDTPRHLYVFTGDSLRLMGQNARFERIQVYSTIRHAGIVYMSHKAIAKTGTLQYDLVPGWPRRRDRVVAPLVTLLEAVVKKKRPFAGEELVFVGKKEE